MSIEELTQQFIAAAAPELAKLAASYAPEVEHALAVGAGAAAGAATAEIAKLKALSERMAASLVEHHEFLAKLIPALAAHGIAIPAPPVTVPPIPAAVAAPVIPIPAAPVLTAASTPAEGQEQAGAAA